MVLLALVDHAYCFTEVDIRSYGSNSDAGIFRISTLSHKLQNDTLRLPEDKSLPNDKGKGTFQFVIVGDEAFSLMRNCMCPFPESDLVDAKRVFLITSCHVPGGYPRMRLVYWPIGGECTSGRYHCRRIT